MAVGSRFRPGRHVLAILTILALGIPGPSLSPATPALAEPIVPAPVRTGTLLSRSPLAARGIRGAADATSSIRDRVQTDRLTLRVAGDDIVASNGALNSAIRFTPSGLLLDRTDKDGWSLAFALSGAGSPSNPLPAGPSVRTTAGKTVTYRYELGGLEEWYKNGPRGIEHGFTVPSPLSDDSILTFDLAVNATLMPELLPDSLGVRFLDLNGVSRLRYDGLKVFDASGADLPASLSIGEQLIRITVDTNGAVYPITVDPLLAVEIKTRMIGSDTIIGDEFGLTTSLSGDTLVVGADFAGGGNGQAYVFERNNGGLSNWGETKILTGSDSTSSDSFGTAVSIDGDTTVVGTFDRDQVYIYSRNAGGPNNWGEVKIITGSDVITGDGFGSSVFIYRDTIVVGAPNQNTQTGAAYVFDRNNGGPDNWGQTKVITATDGVIFDGLGYSVGVYSNTVVLGALGYDNDRGAAYVYERNDGGSNNFGAVKVITVTDGLSGDFFGGSVGIYNQRVVVGARLSASFVGSAYLFTKDNGGPNAWGLTKKFTSPDGAFFDLFGGTVVIDGDQVLIGASGHNQDPFDGGIGAAYLYRSQQGGAENWGLVKKIVPSDGIFGDAFSVGMALKGKDAVFGAPGCSCQQGAVYIETLIDVPVASQTASPNPVTFGFPVTVTTNLVSDTGIVTPPTGLVSLTKDGLPFGNAIATSGVANFVTTTLPAGTHVFSGTYNGDVNYGPVGITTTLTVTVAKALSLLSLVSTPNPTLLGQPVTITAATGAIGPATEAQTGTIQFYREGAVLGNPLAVVNGMASLVTTTLPLGTSAISATYSGNSNYTAALGNLVGGQTVNAGPIQISLSNGLSATVPGTFVTYTLAVTNTTSVTATNAPVTVTVPSFLGNLSWTCSASGGSACPANGSGTIGTNVTLAPAGTATFKLSGKPDPSITGTMTLTGAIGGPAGFGGGPFTAADTDTLTPQSSLKVSIVDNTVGAQAGDIVTYTVTVENGGPSTGKGIVIVNFNPALLNLNDICLSTSGSSCIGGPTSSLIALAAGSTSTLSQTVTVVPGGRVTLIVQGQLQQTAITAPRVTVEVNTINELIPSGGGTANTPFYRVFTPRVSSNFTDTSIAGRSGR